MSEQIEKFSAAERQLRSAIVMFLNREDPVTVHTVIGAALQIFVDLNQRKGRGGVAFNCKYVRKERMKEWHGYLTKSRNFFKHADHDPEGTTNFSPRINEVLLFEAVVHYDQLTDTPIKESQVYKLIFFSRNPDLLHDGVVKQHLLTALGDGLIGRDDDFQIFKDVIDRTPDGLKIPLTF